MTPHETWALLALAGGLLVVFGWLAGQWRPWGRLLEWMWPAACERIWRRGWDRGADDQWERMTTTGVMTAADAPTISLTVPANGAEPAEPNDTGPTAGPGEMTDDEWATELHSMNNERLATPEDVPGRRDPSTAPPAGALDWNQIRVSITPLDLLKIEGMAAATRHDERLAAWMTACRFGMDRAAVEARGWAGREIAA